MKFTTTLATAVSTFAILFEAVHSGAVGSKDATAAQVDTFGTIQPPFLAKTKKLGHLNTLYDQAFHDFHGGMPPEEFHRLPHMVRKSILESLHQRFDVEREHDVTDTKFVHEQLMYLLKFWRLDLNRQSYQHVSPVHVGVLSKGITVKEQVRGQEPRLAVGLNQELLESTISNIQHYVRETSGLVLSPASHPVSY
jgi:hypothetical protein